MHSDSVNAASDFDSIEAVLADIAAGKLVIVVDDEDRENEGDLVMAAEKVTPDAVNFMATHRPRVDLRADHRGARRAARPPAHGAGKSRKLSHGFHRLRGCGERRDHRHQRRTTARAPSRCSSIPKATPQRSRAAGPRLPAARQARRRLAARGAHGGERRSRAARRAAARRRALRNPQCRRHDGAPAGAAEIPKKRTG